jgi:hypothetical protein
VHKPTQLVAALAPVLIGVEDAPHAFTRTPVSDGAFNPRRLRLDGDDAFDLTFWCGTCPLVFERLRGAKRTLTDDQLQGVLNAGLTSISPEVISAVSMLVQPGNYLPLLLNVHPSLVLPSGPDDYFALEQVEHRGFDSFWGLPENPHTPYYRGAQWRVDKNETMFEFVVPMVPPTWNDAGRISHYEDQFKTGVSPTVLALSILDHTQPFDSTQAHSGLIHFVLDGHHKLEAAAQLGRPVSVLAFVSLDDSLAGTEHLDRLVKQLGAHSLRRRLRDWLGPRPRG